MTQINSKISDKRLDLLRAWLEKDLGYSIEKLEPASADASFRRYFRAYSKGQSYIVMDAPPQQEPLSPFINTAQALISQNVHAPKIFAQNISAGFLLLEDFGDQTYLDALKARSSSADALYEDAIAALIDCQSGIHAQTSIELADYSAEKLNEEMEIFSDWYLGKHLGLQLNEQQIRLWDSTKEYLIGACLEQPEVWVHRDYHSRNLMLIEGNNPGVIDFQDMVIGPIAYDLASIFKDCYIEWPREQQLIWLENYRKLAVEKLDIAIESKQLIRWYDLTGLQRHLKVLGIFCRLYHRDGKSNYLNDLPLTARYVLEVLPRYPELNAFEKTFSEFIRLAQTDIQDHGIVV